MESTKRQLANKNEESVICKPMVWVDVVYIFAVSLRDEIKILVIVFQKVCKFRIDYFCNAIFKNELLWNLHMNKSRK